MDWHSYYTNGPGQAPPQGATGDLPVAPGPIGFANLLVSMQDGSVVFDPHVTGACLTVLEEEGATTLRDILTEWLG